MRHGRKRKYPYSLPRAYSGATPVMTRFVPAFLLVSAIYVDECIDMGLLGPIVIQ